MVRSSETRYHSPLAPLFHTIRYIVPNMLSRGIFTRRDLKNHFSAQNSPTFGACKIVKIYPRHLKLWNLTFQTLYSISRGKNVASSGLCKFRSIVWIQPSRTFCIRTILFSLRCAINKGWWEATSSIQLLSSFDFLQGKQHQPGVINSCLFLAVSRNAWLVQGEHCF